MRSLLYCLGTCAMGLLPASVAQASDVQMWNEVDISAPLAHGLSFTVPLVARNSFDLANPQLAGGGVFFDYTATGYLTLTGGYLFVSLPNTGPGYTVNVPLAAFTLHRHFGSFRAGDRNRVEKLIGLPQDPIRYRNKVSLDLPLAGGAWTPFVSNEIFYDSSKSAWTQNRFQAGVGRRLTNSLRLDVFFLERSDLKVSSNAVHAAGVTLEIHLGGERPGKGIHHGEN